MNAPIPSRRSDAVAANHDIYLDWLRGIAALLVLFTHVRNGYFVKWSDLDPSSQNHINYVLFVVTRLGREAVIVFFVLSGYLVGGHALSSYRKGRYTLQKYLVARIARLYVVIVPALILTGIFDALHGAWNASRDGLTTFLVNLFLLQGIYGGTYGSNVPLWSLSYEWWFYILFGLTLAAAASRSARTTVASALVLGLCASMLALKCTAILLMFPLWLFGVAARTLPSIRLPRKMTIPVSLMALCFALGISSVRWDWKGDFAVGIATTAFIYFSRGLEPLRYRWFPLGKNLAAFSFSLYAIHYPLNDFVMSFVIRKRLTHAGVVDWVLWTGIVIGEAVICYGFYWLFERRTPAVRAWLDRILPSHASAMDEAGRAPIAGRL